MADSVLDCGLVSQADFTFCKQDTRFRPYVGRPRPSRSTELAASTLTASSSAEARVPPECNSDLSRTRKSLEPSVSYFEPTDGELPDHVQRRDECYQDQQETKALLSIALCPRHDICSVTASAHDKQAGVR